MKSKHNLSPSWAEQRKTSGYRIETLNNLSAPKGVRYTCELTGGPATVCLVTPFLKLYYNSKEEAVLSWEGIMHKLVHMLGPLREKPTLIGSEEERKKREHSIAMSKRALIDLTRGVATKFFVLGKYQLAVPGATLSLNFSKDIYGADAVDIVPAYLLLAEANLGLKKFKEAQGFLSLANWIVMKEKDCNPAIRSKLHRNFGKLYAAQGKYIPAANELAKDIYFMSLCSGPEHVDTSGGYFQLAKVFDAQHRVESALALYDKVVDIWYKYLTAIRISKKNEVLNGEDRNKVPLQLDDAQIGEATVMLKDVLKARGQFLGQQHIATAEALYTLGLLQLLGTEQGQFTIDAAKENISAAKELYENHLGSSHPSTKDIANVLLLLS